MPGKVVLKPLTEDCPSKFMHLGPGFVTPRKSWQRSTVPLGPLPDEKVDTSLLAQPASPATAQAALGTRRPASAGAAGAAPPLRTTASGSGLSPGCSGLGSHVWPTS